jgi:hypothetical protein
MQKGALLPASQLIKLITRGRTSRLSVDPLLEFFRPLEAWLETQNRDEPVSVIRIRLKTVIKKLCFRLLDGLQTWTMFHYIRTLH